MFEQIRLLEQYPLKRNVLDQPALVGRGCFPPSRPQTARHPHPPKRCPPAATTLVKTCTFGSYQACCESCAPLFASLVKTCKQLLAEKGEAQIAAFPSRLKQCLKADDNIVRSLRRIDAAIEQGTMCWEAKHVDCGTQTDNPQQLSPATSKRRTPLRLQQPPPPTKRSEMAEKGAASAETTSTQTEYDIVTIVAMIEALEQQRATFTERVTAFVSQVHASVEKAVRLFDESFTCHNCFNILVDPKLLSSCGHTFCESCTDTELRRVLNDVDGEIEYVCPDCGKASPGQQPPISNVALDQLVDRWASAKSILQGFPPPPKLPALAGQGKCMNVKT